jgi:hypothetical protein
MDEPAHRNGYKEPSKKVCDALLSVSSHALFGALITVESLSDYPWFG